MKYAVGIVQPKGYIHSECFREVADAVRESIRDLGHEISEPGSLGARTVLFGPHLMTHDPPPNSILYNLEQVDPDSRWLTPEVIDRFKRFETWDYSAQNIRRLKSLGVSAKLVPVGYHPTLSRIEPAEPLDIDVLFYGSVNERRAVVLDELRRRGANVVHVFGVYGRERDDLISRSKIAINFHYYNASVFGIVRCSYLMANRVAVVSETPINWEFKAGIYWNDYKGLADSCIHLLKEEETRMLLASIGYDAIRARPQAEYLRAVLG